MSQWFGLGNGRVWNEEREKTGGKGASGSEISPFIEDKKTSAGLDCVPWKETVMNYCM